MQTSVYNLRPNYYTASACWQCDRDLTEGQTLVMHEGWEFCSKPCAVAWNDERNYQADVQGKQDRINVRTGKTDMDKKEKLWSKE